MTTLHVLSCGPTVSIQDLGRPGYLDQGVSQSGAADALAIAEGAALLGQGQRHAAIEMAGFGGEFRADAPIRIALTGAPMRALLDGEPLIWNASHAVEPGQTLSIGAATKGMYGYLHIGGGIATEPQLGSRATHIRAGIGRALEPGDSLPIGLDNGDTGMGLQVSERFDGGTIRVMQGFQTALFDPETLERFEATEFSRGPRANRMGVELAMMGEGFAIKDQLAILSEIILPGDIQMTGDGRPYVLLPECQTTGGYPRIATVLPCDMPRIAQAPAGAPIRFQFVDRAEAEAAQAAHETAVGRLKSQVYPLVRDVADMADLLAYQLIGGVVSAADDMEEWG